MPSHHHNTRDGSHAHASGVDARNAIAVDFDSYRRKRSHQVMAGSQQQQQVQPQQSTTDVTLAWELLRAVVQRNATNPSNSNSNNAISMVHNVPSPNTAMDSRMVQPSQSQVATAEARAESTTGPLGTTADVGAVGSNIMTGPQEQPEPQATVAASAAVANEVGGPPIAGEANPVRLWSHQPVINCLAVMLLKQRLEQLQQELREQTSQYHHLANVLSDLQENLGAAATGVLVNVNRHTNTSNAASASALDTNIAATTNNIAAPSMDMILQASQQQDSTMFTALVAEIASTSEKQQQQQRRIESLCQQIESLRAPVVAQPPQHQDQQQQQQQQQQQDQNPNVQSLLQRLIQMQLPFNGRQQQQQQPPPPTRPQQSHVHSLIQFILEEQQRQQQPQQEPTALAAQLLSQLQQAIVENQQNNNNNNNNNSIVEDPDVMSIAAVVNNPMPKVPLFINVPHNPWKRYKKLYRNHSASRPDRRQSDNDRLHPSSNGEGHVVPPPGSTSSNASTASAGVATRPPAKDSKDVLVTAAASLIQLYTSSGTDDSPGETGGSSSEDDGSPGSNSSNDESPLTGVGNSGSSSDEAHHTTDEDSDEKHPEQQELQRYSPSSLSNDAYKKVLAARREPRDTADDRDDDETKIIMPPPRQDMEMVSSLQDAASSASSASSLSMESTVDLVILD